MDWLPASIFSVAVGVIAFFLKKTYSNFETKMRELQASGKQQMEHLREDFRAENSAIREDFRASMNIQDKRIDRLEEAIRDMPYRYVTKEDFIRSVSSMDKKLERILSIITVGQRKEG